MPAITQQRAQKLFSFALVLLILKVTTSIVLGYRDYVPPNFAADFLQGREAHFWGAYAGAFYAHILAGPITLVCGLLLVFDRFRIRFPRGHRTLGKLQIALVLLVLAPSGLWMARYAQMGPAAGAGFAILALLTATFAVQGWRTAVQRRFSEHRVWMWRCYLLLCSAVVLRLIGGVATITRLDANWLYPAAAWASWILPLTAHEVVRWLRGLSSGSPGVHRASGSRLPISTSPPAIEISPRH